MSAQSALVPAGSRALGLGFNGNIGNIDAYISAVNRLPMLTHEEEVSLAKNLRDNGDLDAALERRRRPELFHQLLRGDARWPV